MIRKTINIPDALAEIMAEIKRRERYRSDSELVASFVRHWALSQQEHAITGGIASLPGMERDEIDEGLLALVKSGKGKKGSWLKAQIYAAIKEICGQDAQYPTVDQVLGMIPARVAAAAKKEGKKV